MRFFWKVLLFAIPLGSYWLYKKGSRSSSGGFKEQPQQAEVNKTTPPEEKQENVSRREEKEIPPAQIIERLTEIDGVTRRVAENLVERGIKSKEALLKLSEEELKSIKGIGPKRAAKILNLG